LDQALHFRRAEDVNHAVFMGMGEPMLNLDAVLEAARRLPDLGIGHRRTTISTVGWLPGLRRFVDEVAEPVRLALSLHAPNDSLRSEPMPVNDRYPLSDLVHECTRYFELRRRRVFVEYVMLRGVNDRVEQARELAALLDRRIFKVNLIPYNPTGMYEGSTRKAIAAFKDVLDRLWPALVPAADGVAVECELYDCTEELVERLARIEPPGWSRGSVELEDGRAVDAFVGEAELAARGVDVSEHGGWAAFVRSRVPRRARGSTPR